MARKKLNLLSIRDIIEAGFANYDPATVRRYFREGILVVHRKALNGRSNLSYYGSVKIRLYVFEELRIKYSIAKIGKLFRLVGGEDDALILSKLNGKKTEKEVAQIFKNAVVQCLEDEHD